MTARIYMGVDARRDHSFRIPRPDLTETTGSPNACNACHDDRDASWASEQLRDRSGNGASVPHFASVLHNARSGFANDELVALLRDNTVPGIARGTALTLFRAPLGNEETTAIQAALADGDVQVRMGALRALRLAPLELQMRLAVPLLGDPVRSVRIEAAALLAPLRHYLPVGNAAAFNAAAREFRAAQLAIASRPEAHSSLGDFEAGIGNALEARRHFEQALAMEPNAPAVRVNFADALRRFGDDALAETVLRDGIRLDANNAGLRHSLGLLLARSTRTADSLVELRRAAELQPDNSRYQYVLAIALNSAGDAAAAIATLESAALQFPGDFDIAWALVTINRDQGNRDRALNLARKLVERYPENPDVAALLESLATP